MASWTVWIVPGVFGNAIYSLVAKKPVGLYTSALIHIVLGIWLLSSIGLYVLGLAVLEIIAAVIMNIKAIS